MARTQRCQQFNGCSAENVNKVEMNQHPIPGQKWNDTNDELCAWECERAAPVPTPKKCSREENRRQICGNRKMSEWNGDEIDKRRDKAELRAQCTDTLHECNKSVAECFIFIFRLDFCSVCVCVCVRSAHETINKSTLARIRARVVGSKRQFGGASTASGANDAGTSQRKGKEINAKKIAINRGQS